MPLSLVELSKKKRRKENDSAPVVTNAATMKVPQKKRLASQTAMPWTGSDLSARPSKSRRRLDVDAAMNEDWLSLHEEPLFWLDSETVTRSKLAAIQDRLMDLEENIHDMISQSLRLVKGVFLSRA